MMKMKSRGQFVAAHRFKRVFVDRQYTSAKTGSPDMSVEETDMAQRPALGLDHKWCQYNDEMAPGHHEVVHHSQWPRIDQVRLDQPSSGVDAIEQQRRPRLRHEADIPQSPILLDLRMGRERQAGEVRTPVDEWAGSGGCPGIC